jgi:NAD(P)-dependent dehydrogenase (short-subunit alcohol dehydrogenase family)
MTSQITLGFQGKTALITGGGNGIGAATARRLAREGAHVALIDVNADAAQSVADRINADFSAAGARAVAHACDVSNKAQVDATVVAVAAQFGRIDVLVNNAGIFKAAPFLEVTEADWDAVINVNLKGHFLMAQAVARAMTSQTPNSQGTLGAIVNMSSVNGIMAIPSIASYNASKGAINQLTRAMALALADHHIRVNAVAPGTIATELAAKAVLTDDAAKQRILGRTPMKRLGTAEEVAEVIAWLASDAASYVTGEIVYVDGGRMSLNYTVPV